MRTFLLQVIYRALLKNDPSNQILGVGSFLAASCTSASYMYSGYCCDLLSTVGHKNVDNFGKCSQNLPIFHCLHSE